LENAKRGATKDNQFDRAPNFLQNRGAAYIGCDLEKPARNSGHPAEISIEILVPLSLPRSSDPTTERPIERPSYTNKHINQKGRRNARSDEINKTNVIFSMGVVHQWERAVQSCGENIAHAWRAMVRVCVHVCEMC